MIDPKPRVLVVDDEGSFRTVLRRELERKGWVAEAAGGGEEALELLSRRVFDAVILDLDMPGTGGIDVLRRMRERDIGAEVVVLTGKGSIPSAVEAVKLGAHDYLTKPCEIDAVDQAARRAAGRSLLSRENRLLRRSAERSGEALLGDAPPMQALRRLVERAAASDAAVLILGESGTGKELVAREIHGRSARSALPLVAVNCAALNATLLESELFGHEKGAFTGAERARAGLFEAADGGTLFLDEIGDMPQELQSRLLRAVQSGEIRRVGSDRPKTVDVRVIAATHRDLAAEIRKGTFREDLYYRLQALVVRVPPLRERAGDIPALARHFLGSARSGCRDCALTPGALDALSRHPWPGNVRELRNAVERLAILSDGPEIGETEVRAALAPAPPSGRGEALPDSLEELEKLQIARILAACAGRKPEAAKRLGISLKTLYNKIERYSL